MKTTVRTPNQKIDKNEIMAFALEACNYIESWNTQRNNELPKPDLKLQRFTRPKKDIINQSIKNAYHKRLAIKIKTYLYNDHRVKDEDKISIDTYHSYLSDIRRYLKRKTGLVHFNLRKKIKQYQEQYPLYKDILQTINDANALSVGLAKSNTLKILLSTQSSDAQALYKALYKLPINHVLVDALVKDPAQTAQRNKKISDNLQKRKRNAKTISYNAIYGAVDQLLVSNSYADLAIGIALTTGRRAIEVLLTGTFKPTKSKYKILFSGQAKKGYGVKDTPYEIPVMIDAEIILKSVDKLRKNDTLNQHIEKAKNTPYKTVNKALNSRVAGVLNRRIKKLFDDNTMVFKDTRVIAINVAVARIFPREEYASIDVNVFVKQFAGHDDDEEFKNYQHIKVNDDESNNEFKKLNVQKRNPNNVNKSALDTLVNELRGIIWQSGRMSTYNKIIDGLEEKQMIKPFKITQTAIIKGKISSGRAGIAKFLGNNEAKKAIAAFHKANDL